MRLHAQPGAHGPLGVVLVGHGSAEQGDDAVAEQLVDAAAELLDVGDETLEAGLDQALDLLRVTVLGQRGVADEVGEEHGDDAPFLGRDEDARRGDAAAADRSAPPLESAGRTRHRPSWPCWHATALDPPPASRLTAIHPRSDDPDQGCSVAFDRWVAQPR